MKEQTSALPAPRRRPDVLAALGIRRPAFMADALCCEPSVADQVGCFVMAEHRKTAKPLALQACGRCLVLVECREYALADPTLLGIWGGTDTAARSAIRSNRAKEATRATA